MSPTKPKRAAIYLRISDDRTGEAAGVARQEQDCRALAAKKGWQLVEVYTDNDLSAYSGKVRPAYQRLLEDMRGGLLDAVAVWHEDRLHRQPRELEQFIDVATVASVQLATVTGDIDLATAEGKLRARLLGNVGAYESEHKAARIRRKHEELAAAGRDHGGGSRPFGYEEDRVTIRAAEAKLIRDAAKRVLAGASLRGIIREWNAAGVVTSGGKPWYTSAVHRLLCSGRIAGKREHHGKIVADAQWPGIISPTDSEKLRTLLRDPARRQNEGARRYLLTGYARCGPCGGRLHARPRGDGARCYVCASGPGFNGCGKIRVIAEPFEQLAADVLMHRLDSPAFARALQRAASTPRQSGGEDPATVQQHLDDLAKDFGEGTITRSEWLAARAPLEARRDTATNRVARDQRTTAVQEFVGKPGALTKTWAKLTIEQQRAIVAAMVDHVTVGPAIRGLNRFDHRRVNIEWRY